MSGNSNEDSRKDTRRDIPIRVKFKSATIEEFIEQYSKDVSRGGIFIKHKDPSQFPVRTLIKFSLLLADGTPFIQGIGRVVWIRELSQARVDRPPGMGIKFIKLDEKSRAIIDRIVKGKDVIDDGSGPPGGEDILEAAKEEKEKKEEVAEAKKPEEKKEEVEVKKEEEKKEEAAEAKKPEEKKEEAKIEAAPEKKEEKEEKKKEEAKEEKEKKEAVKEEVRKPQPPPRAIEEEKKTSNWIWGVVILIILVLFFFTMIKKQKKEETQAPPEEEKAQVEETTPPVAPTQPVKETVKFQISTNPEGATIFVNGVEKGKTPLKELEMEEGEKVTIKASLLGYGSVTQELEIKKEMQPVVLNLQKIPAIIEVDSIPPGATISFNGKPQGKGIVTIENVDIHAINKIGFKLKGYEPKEISVDSTAAWREIEGKYVLTIKEPLNLITPSPPPTPVEKIEEKEGKPPVQKEVKEKVVKEKAKVTEEKVEKKPPVEKKKPEVPENPYE